MKVAIASVSLGRAAAGHSMQAKLEAASQAGLDGVEIFWECFEDFARSLHVPGSGASGGDEARYKYAAKEVRRLCDSLKLECIALQPFVGYDGLLDPTSRLVEVELWLQLMRILGATFLQIPANFADVADPLYANTAEKDADEVIARNLTKLADLVESRSPGVLVTYETMAWSTHSDSWRQALDVIRSVKRESVVLCVDTFHIAGREYGDPSSENGQASNSADFAASVQDFASSVKRAEIGYVQLSDATLMSPPLPRNKLTDHTQRPRMNWSRTSRVFPYLDGYLPLDGLLNAIFDTGYDGWFSMETFNISLFEKSQSVPRKQAESAMQSWNSVLRKQKARVNT